jgi:hypothetical protein
MAKKISRAHEQRQVVYSKDRWDLLRSMQDSAVSIMDALGARGIDSIVHGSLARGDVSPSSDIDVFIPEVTPSYIIEWSLQEGGHGICRRELTQATPAVNVKGIISLDEKTKVTFPLLALRAREREFYRFGGEASLEGLKGHRRVPGVDKRLMLIVPKDYGHCEFSILGRGAEAARIIGVGMEILNERTRVLSRRDEVGRTGIYLKEELREGETFEERLKETASRDPSLRRLMQQRGMEFKY